MTRRTAPRLLIVALAVVAASACGVPTQEHPTQLSDNDVRVVRPTTTTVPAGSATESVNLYLVSGDHLTPVAARISTPPTVRETIRVLAAARGNALAEGVRTAIRDPEMTTFADRTRGIAQIELSDAFDTLAPDDQILATAQVVVTLTGLPGVGQVRFTRVGKPVSVPRADGSFTTQPVARHDYRRLLPTT